MARKWQERMDSGGKVTHGERRAESGHQNRARPKDPASRYHRPETESDEIARVEELLKTWPTPPDGRGR